MGKRKPKIVENVPESEDEEISEDGAFDSEDERQYGAFFETPASDASSDDDDSDDDGDGGQYMLDLLEQLDSKPNAKDDHAAETKGTTAVHGPESASAVVGTNTAAVTLDALMAGLHDTQGFGALQQSMRHLTQTTTTTTPVARVVSDRAHRQVAYAAQKRDVSQWNEAVQTNRKAETLDFRPKDRLDTNHRDVMLAKFVPTTPLEQEIHAALEAAGETEEAMLRQAEDDLGAKEMTIEEYRKRRSQLAQMRALMFYHEQKRHKINKIKSKQYRRIRKRQREKQKELEVEDNPELMRELREKEEVERMKERATLAHKNTSKWAKRILKRGKNVDADTRKALSAQLKRGDDLRKRMQATAGSDDDDDDEEDLIAAATKTLEEVDEDKSDGNDKGLFKLAFMQKGVERQREKAKEEARQLLLELKATEEERQESDDNEEAPKKAPRKKVATATTDEMKAVMKDGDLVVSSIKFNTGTSVATSGAIDVGDFGEAEQARVEQNSTTFEQTKQVTKKKPRSTAGSTTTSGVVAAPAATPKMSSGADDANPWLPSDETKKTKSSSVSKRKVPVRGYVDVERAVDLLDSTPNTEQTTDGAVEATQPDKKITLLTQEELIHKAFAAPSQEEVEGEFEAEKELVRQEEVVNSKKKKKSDMSSSNGWGEWAGSGVRPSKRARPTAPAEEKVVPKRKDDKRPNVIISQARIKRTANKYMLKDVPYPFTSREEYEKSLKGGIGKEWNVSSGVKAYTRPEIITRAGKIIKPISKKMKVKRAPAKF